MIGRTVFEFMHPDDVPYLLEHLRDPSRDHSHGRIWLGFGSALGYLENARFVSLSGVPGDSYIDSIAEDEQGNLWVAHRDAGLLRVSPDLKVQPVPWQNSGKGERRRSRP